MGHAPFHPQFEAEQLSATALPAYPTSGKSLVSANERYTSLDAARGVAAIIVVLYHWIATQTFQLPAVQYVAEHGWIVVDLFFAMSGLLFARIFAEDIGAKNTCAASFFTNRIARLYPLHFATLAAATTIYCLPGPRPFAVDNEPSSLFLNIIGLQGLGPHSFNHPAWSISIEMICYGLFFICARMKHPRIHFAALLLIGIALPAEADNLSRGLVGFFGGAIAANLSRRTALLGLAIGLSAVLNGCGFALVFVLALVFPCGARLLLDLRVPTFGRALGDISYSIYLWDVPAQLVFAGTAASLGMRPSFTLFVLALVSVSIASRRWIEIPGQRVTRSMIRAITGLVPKARRTGRSYADQGDRVAGR